MKFIRLPALWLALAFILTGCASGWQLGDNTISSTGAIRFYNGVSIEFPGQMETFSEKAAQKIGDLDAAVSIYMLTRDGSFGYMAMQVSAERGFADMLKDDLSDAQFNEFIEQFTGSMLERVRQLNPDLPIIGPTLARQDYTSPAGNQYRIADLTYITAGQGQNMSVRIKVILTEHDVIAVLSLQDSNLSLGYAEEVFRSIQYE